MENKIKPEESMSVTVGRFQTDDLTDGHKEFLDYVLSLNFNSNLLIIGLSPLRSTFNNPLDYEARKLMIDSLYPGKFTILYIQDCPSDIVWSKKLDEIIDNIKDNRDVVLFGSRDSFINHYFGKYKKSCEEYKQTVFVSATERRRTVSKQVKNTKEWRAGNIYATQNRFPTAFSTVDCAIFDNDTYTHIYLGKKKEDTLYRFIGGFTDPLKDDSHETAARREAYEETNMECNVISYIGSHIIDDWRYRSEIDKIITDFYLMVKSFGKPTASDDINELYLKRFDELKEEDFEKPHRPLFNMLKQYIKNIQPNQNIKSEVKQMMD